MKRLFSLLGFAQRAGKLVSGETAVEQVLRRGKARMLLLATDASESTIGKLTGQAEKRSVPVHRIATREQIGEAIGRSPRASVAVVDEQFAGAIAEALRAEEHGGG